MCPRYNGCIKEVPWNASVSYTDHVTWHNPAITPWRFGHHPLLSCSILKWMHLSRHQIAWCLMPLFDRTSFPVEKSDKMVSPTVKTVRTAWALLSMLLLEGYVASLVKSLIFQRWQSWMNVGGGQHSTSRKRTEGLHWSLTLLSQLLGGCFTTFSLKDQINGHLIALWNAAVCRRFFVLSRSVTVAQSTQGPKGY